MPSAELHICVSYGDFVAEEIFTILLSIFAVIIHAIIIIHASIKLPKQKQMHKTFKILFYISSIVAMFTSISCLIATILCVQNYQILSLIFSTITVATYFLLLMTLLTTLLFRLRSTFQGSIYEITLKKQCCFAILYVSCILFAMLSVTLFILILYAGYYDYQWLGSYAHYVIDTILVTSACIAGLIYVFTAIWACYLFTNNLMCIARLNKDNNDDDETGNCELNERQKKMISNITRYVSLFCVATLTSFICVVVISSRRYVDRWEGKEGQIYGTSTIIDSVINMICLYFQYSFNVTYYETYCKCLEKCWAPYFIKKARSNVNRISNNQKCNGKYDPISTASEI